MSLSTFTVCIFSFHDWTFHHTQQDWQRLRHTTFLCLFKQRTSLVSRRLLLFSCYGVLGPVGFDLFPDPLVVGVVVVTGPHHGFRGLGLQSKACTKCLVEHLEWLKTCLEAIQESGLANLNNFIHSFQKDLFGPFIIYEPLYLEWSIYKLAISTIYINPLEVRTVMVD